jgi:hypothetical protein
LDVRHAAAIGLGCTVGVCVSIELTVRIGLTGCVGLSGRIGLTVGVGPRPSVRLPLPWRLGWAGLIRHPNERALALGIRPTDRPRSSSG